MYSATPWRRILLALAALLLVTGTSRADEPQPAEIMVYPPDVKLNTLRDRQSLIVQARYSDGITRDVTSKAVMSLADPSLAKVDQATLHPAADGKTELTVEYAGLSVKIPVEVAAAATERPISFQLDVMPTFMRSGCNMGSCHGAARGKDGFRLSLFGFDPLGDHHRLTREISGRRINLALPESSLILEKGAGRVPHGGGKRFEEGGEIYATLVRWLTAGAPLDAGEVPKVVSLELYPKGAVLDGQGETQKLTVRAKYSDGTDRDVTSLAVFISGNDNSAVVSPEGMVEAQNRGEAFVMARYDTHTVGSHFIVLPKGLQFAWTETPANNYIDELIYDKLKKLRIQPSELCSDEEFLRRASLDIAGVLPTVDDYSRFMQDQAPDKRERLVDELLYRKEFVEMWVMNWAELLQIRTTRDVSYKSTLRYYNWLQDKIANNVPTDKMVQELLASNGGTFSNAATKYYQTETETLKVSENVAQVFMGMRIQCAQCHNHPFDRWTMDDYYSFAAFFAQIGRKQGEDPREIIVFNSGGGEVKHPVSGAVMPPKCLGGAVPDVAGKDRREVMAKWLASAENPYFASNLANIVWAHFFGKGIINEVDDVRVSNPPVNPELLDALAARFTEYNYDFKKLVRDICTSRTYQLATQTNETNETDDRNFSHALLRRVRRLPSGARAVQIADGNTSTYFLETFGRASRATVCACEVKMEPNLSQALHLLNGDTVNSKIKEGKVVERLLAEQKSPQQVIDELYIRCLSRHPTDK